MNISDQVDKIIKILKEKSLEELKDYDPLVDLINSADETISIKDSIIKDVSKTMEKRNFIYCANKDYENPLEMAAYYHLTKVSVDYDVCLYNMVVYGILFPYVNKNRQITEYELNKYNWANGRDYAYRGDTMNSFNTPIKEFIRLFGDVYSNPSICVLNTSGRNAGKFKVPDNKYYGWYDFILKNLDYFYDRILPKSAIEYINNYHKLGNFIPVPFASSEGEINRPRGIGKTKDFWDICLYDIYRWFKSSKNECSRDDTHLKRIVGNEKNVILLKKWLINEFRIWEKFVEMNYLQDFCDEELVPVEYWRGHFGGEVMPIYINEFLQFFENASRCMNKRNERICGEIKKRLSSEGK